MRVIKSSNDFFDILDGIGGGTFVTIGYVTSADLNVPVVKKKNPVTNRMKGYNDYSVFQGEGDKEIAALVKLTSYNFNYRKRQSVHDEYHNRVKPETNAIRQKFGIEDVATRKGYKDVLNFGSSGQEVYSGNNEKLFGNSYSPQNMFKPLKIESTVYTVGQDGHIMKALSQDSILPYLKSKTVSGVSALRKMGADEAKIQDYIKQIKDLKFSYRNFEANSILYIVATVKGEKLIYINNNLQRCVDDININPEDFIKIAQKKYEKDLTAATNIKNTMKVTESNLKYIITESELKKIIAKSVEKILSEASKSPTQTWRGVPGTKMINDQQVRYKGKTMDIDSLEEYAYYCLRWDIEDFEHREMNDSDTIDNMNVEWLAQVIDDYRYQK